MFSYQVYLIRNKMEVRNLEPKALWSHFSALNAVPRASKKEDQVVQFVIDFGKGLGLETLTDQIGNVVIRKPATTGMEHSPVIVLQAHLDMVHQKNNDSSFDFSTQGIKMIVDGDWVKADGTTLGADNGIGVAAIMAILSSSDIVHPAIEALFTIDEETGMTGASLLDAGMISGRVLLNLDTEDDNELCIGCAGGVDTTSSYSYRQQPVTENAEAFVITVKGLQGGHSGMDIIKGRANANKLMNRILYYLNEKVGDIGLASLDGGSLRNAIPRESVAVITVPVNSVLQLKECFAIISADIKREFASLELKMSLCMEATDIPASILAAEDLKKILNAIYAIPNGVYRMSPDIEGLVETSSNLAKVTVKDGTFITQSLQRSSVDSTKDEVATSVRAALENMGCEVVHSGDYPGWKPNPGSAVLALMKKLYKENFGNDPHVAAVHAGLECGIIGGHLPEMDMISFGPTILGAHSPEEKVQVSSVQKFWKFLLNVLSQTIA